MANKFSVKDTVPQIKFPFIVAKEIEKQLSDAERKDKIKAISQILTNNRIRHSIIHDIVVVHDLRIMDECCEFVWYMDLAVIANQLTEEVIEKIAACSFPTLIQQNGTQIVPVYTCAAGQDVIVIETVFDRLSDSDKQNCQIIYLSPDAKIL